MDWLIITLKWIAFAAYIFGPLIYVTKVLIDMAIRAKKEREFLRKYPYTPPVHGSGWRSTDGRSSHGDQNYHDGGF